jgi:hypothetical protein
MDNNISSGTPTPQNGHKDLDARIAEIEAQLAPVPAVLKARPQWMVWRDEDRTKIPIDPHTGRRGSSTDPAKWSTFQRAIEAYASDPTLSGVATAVTADDPYACLDLDDCLDPETGEFVSGKEQLASGIENVGSYAEISPSGEGIKIFGTGILKSAVGPGRHPLKIEAYDTGRFLTVTGQKIEGLPSETRDIQRALNRVWEEAHGFNGNGDYKDPVDVAAIMKGVPEGSRDTELWRLACRFRHYGVDFPEAVTMVTLAAANCSPPFPQDKAREKVVRAYNTYPVEPQIPDKRANGTNGTPEPPDPFAEDRPRGLQDRKSVGEAIANGVPRPEMIIDGILYKGRIQVIAGQAGHGKSLLALSLSKEVMESGGNVLYLDEEGSLIQVAERLEGMGADPDVLNERFYYFQSAGIDHKNEDLLTQLMETVEDVKPALVVFDSWVDYLAIAGLSENDSVDVTTWVKRILYPIKEAGGTCLLLDHVNKEGTGRGGRGSTAKLAKVDASFRLTLNEAFNRDTMGSVTITVDKDREGALKPSIKFAMGGDGNGRLIVRRDTRVNPTDPADRLSDNDKLALGVLPPAGLRYNAWLAASGLSKGSFNRSCARLVDDFEFVYKDEETLKYMLNPTTPRRTPRTPWGLTSDTTPHPNRPTPPMGWGDGAWGTEVSPSTKELADLKFRALAAIDAMEVGTFEEPTYRRPHDFHAALAEKLGLTQSEVEDLMELIEGDFDWWGLYGLYTNEEMEGME